MAEPYWKNLVQVQTSRSSGPGGQGVNKTESRVDMRFFVDAAPWLTDYQKKRIHQLYPNKINSDGELIVTCQIHRSQKQNLEECYEMLAKIFAHAAHRPRPRVATKATRGSKERRLKAKKSRATIKSGRSTDWNE